MNTIKQFTFAALALALGTSLAFASNPNTNLSSGTDTEFREQNVAYVEEITIMPDGRQSVQRYDSEDQFQSFSPQRMTAPNQPARQRGLSGVEKQELDRLEDDFEQGRITANEYYLRRNAIMRATCVSGDCSEAFGESFLEGSRKF